MNIAVVGPGAIGCLFSALLRRGGHNVCLVDKTPERARLLNETGIRIDEAGGSETLPIHATAFPEQVGPVDIVCLCVKAYDAGPAMQHGQPLMGRDTLLVSLQNGIGSVAAIADRVGRDRIICAATVHGATLLGPGHVAHAGQGVTLIGPVAKQAVASAERVQRLLLGSRIDTRVIEDRDALLWSKLAVNAAINPVTALWNVPNGEILGQAELGRVALQAAREAAAVARAKGITLLYDDAAAEVERVCSATKDNISSMLQDVRRGHRTEIDFINGAVVREAEALGIDTPVNALLAERVRRLER